MNQDLINKAWKNITGEPPPPYPEGSQLIDVLLDLVSHNHAEVGEGFILGADPEALADPWDRMIVSEEPEEALRIWVLQATYLFPIGRSPRQGWIALDLERDDAGEHQVYELADDCSSARLLFPKLESLFEWLASDSPERMEPKSDGNYRPGSVESSIELLWRLHPAILFQSYRIGTWPAEAIEPPSFDPERPGWRRSALLWMLAHFRAHREVEIPPGVNEDDIDPIFAELFRHLGDLEEAMDNDEVPEFVAELTLGDDDELSMAAIEWMVQFDNTRNHTPDLEDDEEVDSLASKTKGLLALLRNALEELERPGHVEIKAGKKDALSEELLEVVLSASTPNLIIPGLIEKILDSSHVEEVYADDETLEKILALTLGMST